MVIVIRLIMICFITYYTAIKFFYSPKLYSELKQLFFKFSATFFHDCLVLNISHIFNLILTSLKVSFLYKTFLFYLFYHWLRFV